LNGLRIYRICFLIHNQSTELVLCTDRVVVALHIQVERRLNLRVPDWNVFSAGLKRRCHFRHSFWVNLYYELEDHPVLGAAFTNIFSSRPAQ